MENLVLKSRKAPKNLEFSNEMLIKLAFHNKLKCVSREARKSGGFSPQKDIHLGDCGQYLGGGGTKITQIYVFFMAKPPKFFALRAIKSAICY